MAEGEEQEGLWFEDAPKAAPHAGSRRRLWVVAATVVCIAALAVPVGVVLASGGPSPSHTRTASHLTKGVAEQHVLSALSATTSSGSFNVSYEFDPPTPPTVTTTTTSTVPTCHVVILGPSSSSSSGQQAQGESEPPPLPSQAMECSGVVPGGPSAQSSTATIGHGTIDTDPFAMVAVSNVTGFGQITLRDNGTDVWEFGGANYGLSPGSSETGPGSSLSGFAGLVEGTLGDRQGALAMGGLASPTGYLDLDESMITGADQTGTGTVDGVPVTVYEISISPAQDANVPGVNAEEAKAIAASSAILKQQGYTGTTVQVSIDASGYIRQTRSVAHFSDGSTTSSQSTFSDFGCAGTVLMPGQSGPSAPPPGCVSPDTGVAPTTTTSSVPTSSTVPSTTSPSTTLPPTTVPPLTVPSTTLPTTSTTDKSSSSTTSPTQPNSSTDGTG